MNETPGRSRATPLWLIDGYNVLRVGFSRSTERAAARGDPPDAADDRGWWSAPRRRALVDLAARASGPAGRDARRAVWIVFDGDRTPELPGAGDDPVSARSSARSSESESESAPDVGVRVVYARSADDWIVRAVKAHPDAAVTVVTADRPLAGRSRHHGAEIRSPHDFVAYCLSLGQHGLG